LKNKITDKETLIEQKGVDIYTASNQCNYCFSTNGQNPVRVERNEERYQVFKVNPKMRGNKQYFRNIIELVEKYKEGLRYYFENRPVKFEDLKVIPTEASK
jgi:hypothetical protein